MTALKALSPIKVIAITAALVFLYAGTLWKLGYDWATDENYSHGLLIPLVIGYVLWFDRDRLARSCGSPGTLAGGLIVLLSLLAHWAGTAGAELYLQRLSLVSMLGGIAIYFWGLRIVRAMSVPLLLLLLAIPIPAIVFNKIAFPLQLFASRCAVAAMRLFDIPVLRQGNVIELMPLNALETRKLEVVEACSGIRSLMTLLTLAVVLAFLTFPRRDNDDVGPRRRLRRFGVLRSIVVVSAAIPIAIVTNAFRVSGTGVLAHYYGTQIADGFFHNFSGWVVYLVAFCLLLAVAWVSDRFSPADDYEDPGGPNGSGPRKILTGIQQSDKSVLDVSGLKGAER